LRPNLLDVAKDIEDIANATRSLLYLGREAYAAHSDGLHVMSHEGLCVEESLKKHLTRRHGDLQEATIHAYFIWYYQH
jgi:hypothetical protein